MTLERRNPLPPGRYWVDVVDGRTVVRWADYFARNTAAGVLSLENSERVENKAGPSVTWTLFRTSAPTDWPAAELGFPTIAGPEVTRRSDTARVPKPLEPIDAAAEIAESLTGALKVVGFLGAGWLLLKAIRELRS